MSRLPWIVQLPIRGLLTFAAAEPWPDDRTVFCLRVETIPANSTLVDEVPLSACAQAGPVITVVADRALRRRSQLRLMEDGSERIWWNSKETLRQLRRGLRIPARAMVVDVALAITVDSRERYPYRFRNRAVSLTRARLDVGDYAVATTVGPAVVERKTLHDFAHSAVTGVLGPMLGELTTLHRAAIVVEARYGSLITAPHVRHGFIGSLIATLSVRYPSVPIAFADTRPLAEEWTYRWLAAAIAEVGQG